MPNIVGVVLLKLLTVDVVLSCEFLFPEHERLFHGQSDSFQVETELKSTEVL